MEYIISDILGKIQKWYFEFFVEKDIPFGSSISEEIENDEEDSYDEDAFVYLYDNILELSSSNYEEFSDIVSLLTLEYFNIICSEELEPNEEDIQVLNLLKESNKEDFIEKTQNSEDDILFTILSMILEYYEFGYVDILDFECYSYDNMDKAYKSDIGKKLYEEFHPNLANELRALNKQRRQNQIIKTIEKLEITSLFKFIYYLLASKQDLTDKYVLSYKFSTKLRELKRTNNKLYNKILSYLIGYYYIVMDKKQNSDEELDRTDRQILDDLRNDNLKDIFNRPELESFVFEFINYDFMEYDKLLNESSDKVKSMVKKLNGNNNFQNK